jgi:quinol monooxygenase YgiN
MIRVVAVLTAKPGRRQELLQLFRANVPAVQAEAGCVEYQPFIDAENGAPVQATIGPDAIVALETWASLKDLEAHRSAPHMIAFGKAAKDIMAERKIHVFAPA